MAAALHALPARLTPAARHAVAVLVHFARVHMVGSSVNLPDMSANLAAKVAGEPAAARQAVRNGALNSRSEQSHDLSFVSAI